MTETNYTTIESPLGRIYLAASQKSLVGVWMQDQKYFPTIDADWNLPTDNPVLQLAATQLDEYFKGKRHEFSVRVDPPGTAFQREVWQALTDIAFGQTLAYGELARAMGRPRAVRAVAAAIGRNPISIVIPCHRALGADGSLTGYAGGIDRKRNLLELESSQQSLCA